MRCGPRSEFVARRVPPPRLDAREGPAREPPGDLRLDDQRARLGYAKPLGDLGAGTVDEIRAAISAVDDSITPLAVRAGSLRNQRWGPLMRAGIDKSLFARQVERYADVYTSRVSNFLAVGPFAMLRAGRLSLPHDEGSSDMADETPEVDESA